MDLFGFELLVLTGMFVCFFVSMLFMLKCTPWFNLLIGKVSLREVSKYIFFASPTQVLLHKKEWLNTLEEKTTAE